MDGLIAVFFPSTTNNFKNPDDPFVCNGKEGDLAVMIAVCVQSGGDMKVDTKELHQVFELFQPR